MTIGKSILDEVFDRSFHNGNFMPQLDKLDAMGTIDRRKMILMTIRLMEAVDTLEEKVKLLEDATNTTKRDTNKPVQSID